MQHITDLFDAEARFLKLHRRRSNFRRMVEHAVWYAESAGKCHIIETGCAWDTGNWEWQGQSTLVWDWLIKTRPDLDITCHSIDITPNSVANSKAQTQHVRYTCGESVFTLATLKTSEIQKCGLLYLDSFDWLADGSNNMQCAFHHVAELAAVYRDLTDSCMIVVDDRHGPEKGKHWMVEGFMSHYLNQPIAFKNHQIGWIKCPPLPNPVELPDA